MKMWMAVAALMLAAPGVLAQLPPDAVQLDKVKISEKVKSQDLDPVTLKPADPALGTFEHKGIVYGMSDAASRTAFMKSPDTFAEQAAKARWEQNFIQSMSVIWCPVTDEISPGGNTKWNKIGLQWESCCQFCNDTVTDEDFPRAVERLKVRAGKSWDLIGGAKYTEGAKSPVEGAINLNAVGEVAAAPAGEHDHGAAPAAPAAKCEPAYLKGADLKPTYAGGVAKIVENRCLDCHRTGGLAPMALSTLGEIRKWQKNLKTHVASGTMPPWPAGTASNFANGKNLTQREKDTLLAWIDAGYAPGEGKYTPERTFGEWAIGEPAKTIALEKYTIPADDADHIRKVDVDLGASQDQWIVAAEIQADPFLVLEVNGGPLGAYHKGQTAIRLPEGYGFRVKKGEKLPVRVFYMKEKGYEETDATTRIGVQFAKDPAAIKHEVLTERLANDDFTIKAGAEKTEVSATFTFPADGEILSLNPVLRLRGKSVTATAKTPDGKTAELLNIGHWDINYNFQYQLCAPFAAPKGTIVTLTAVYDNSALNVANPDAKADVKAGLNGELLEGWLQYALTAGAATKTAMADCCEAPTKAETVAGQ
jgi:hypothetical protein